MSGKGKSEGQGRGRASESGEAGRADPGRDYGDSAGYGGGGAALDYDDVLGATGRGRNPQNNPLDEVIPDRGGPSDEEVRSLAYSKWEEAGRPEGRDGQFWEEAERELRGARGSK